MNQRSNHEEPPAGKSDAEFELPLAGFAGSPAEQDRQWFEQCYRGDSQPQLTVRAVVMGGILGMFTAVSNLYTTLKIGWSFGVSITACVISFVVWNAVCKVFNGRVSRMSVLENNCMQSTATARRFLDRRNAGHRARRVAAHHRCATAVAGGGGLRAVHRRARRVSRHPDETADDQS